MAYRHQELDTGMNLWGYLGAKLRMALLTVAVAIPVVAIFGLLGTILLLGYSPLNYSRNFSPARPVAPIATQAGYAAVWAAGKWSVVAVDGQDQLVSMTAGSSGIGTNRTLLDPRGAYVSSPSVARSGPDELAAWVSSRIGGHSGLRMREIGSHSSPPAWIVPPVALVEHPDVIAVGPRRFDVFFTSNLHHFFDVYMASIVAGRLTSLVPVVHSIGYAFDPQVLRDRSGGFTLAYFDVCCHGVGTQIRARRLTASGTPRPGSLTLATFPSLPLTSAGMALSLARDPRGGTWVSWIAGSGVALDHITAAWGAETPHLLTAGVINAAAPAVQILPRGSGGRLFVGAVDPHTSYVESVIFNAAGGVVKTQRVEYIADGQVVDPMVGGSSGRPAVLWEHIKGNGSGAEVETASYQKSVVPNAQVKLGLTGADVWLVAVMVVVGSLFTGFGMAVANLLIAAFMLALWPLVSRFLDERYRWIAMSLLIGGTLALIFAANTVASNVILFMHPFKQPYGWYVVLGAVFVTYWVGVRASRNLEPGFRAMLMVGSGLYFVSFMWTLVNLQGIVTGV